MHESFVAVLSSGSCGNSVFVSSGESGLLIDAGISCRELERRLEMFGVEPSSVDAVLLTHEHTDHCRGARRFCSVHGAPLMATAGTLALVPHDGTAATTFRACDAFSVGDLRVRSVPVCHLASDPVAFTVSVDGRKVSVITDLGCVTTHLRTEAADSDLLLIEANYDEDMLMNGSYPEFLKMAISGDHGHLSNDDAAALCADVACDRTAEIVLLHMSRENNRSELAGGAVEGVVGKTGLHPRVRPTEHGWHNGPFRL